MPPSDVPAPAPPPAAGIVAAIPARYGSTRLPAKPLRPVAGRPLIEHVYRRAAAVPGLARVVVLTDDERIGRVVEAFGGEWEMTPSDLASGTDRIAHAARDWTAEAVINVQGDWILDPGLIAALARHLAEHPGDAMATLALPAAPEDLANPAVVKVVRDLAGNALYFSRAPIPHPRRPGRATPLRHLGIYGYRRQTLLDLARLPPTPLEEAESLEQLRALEHGIPIRVLEVAGLALGVDTPEDLERAEEALAAGGFGEAGETPVRLQGVRLQGVRLQGVRLPGGATPGGATPGGAAPGGRYNEDGGGAAVPGTDRLSGART